MVSFHAWIQKVLSEWAQILCVFVFFLLLLIFLVDDEIEESKYHYKWAIIDPPAKRHLNGVSLAGR